MRPRVYIETTIPSYLTGRPSRDIIIAGHQEVTREWWDARRVSFDLFVSQFVIDEAAAGDVEAAKRRLGVVSPLPMLVINEQVGDVASRLLDDGVIPQRAAGDAGHIAVSAVHGMDYLLTWNCAHLANAAIKRRVERLCREQGYDCPVICTPEELM